MTNPRGYRDQAEQRMSVGTGKDTGGLSALLLHNAQLHNALVLNAFVHNALEHNAQDAPKSNRIAGPGCTTPADIHCLPANAQNCMDCVSLHYCHVALHSAAHHIYVYISTWLTCVIVSALRLQ